MINSHFKNDKDNRKDPDNLNGINYDCDLPKNANRGFSKKSIKIDKESRAVVDIHSNEWKNDENYSNSNLASFVTADKLDILIIKELLTDPYIQTLEISIKSGIPLSITHKKRRLIESKVLQTRYFLDFQKLGLYFRFADIFADIKENKVYDLVNQLYLSHFTKNMLKLIKIKTPSEGICIRTMYQTSDELFFLMDEVKSCPFISNVHFSEEIEVIGDNTLNVILNMLNTHSKITQNVKI